MARIASTIRSRINFFSRKRQFQHKPIQNEDAEDTEDFRTRGSEILKAITTAPEATATTLTRSPTARACNEHDSTCINSSDKIEIDLDDVDNKVTKHQDEHKRLQDIKERTDSNGNEWQNRVKRLKHLKRTIELARRKKFDNKGSFAINMVTYRDHKSKPCPNVNGKGYQEKGIASNIRSSGHDDRSRSSESTCVTNDFTLQVIDEEIAYYNTK